MHAFKVISYVRSSSSEEHSLSARMNNHILSRFLTVSDRNEDFRYGRSEGVTYNPNVVEGMFLFNEFENKDEILHLLINEVLQDIDNYKIGYHLCQNNECTLESPCKEWTKEKESGDMPHTIEL
jgi:hypothetical protein